jgi:acyl carrier protein
MLSDQTQQIPDQIITLIARSKSLDPATITPATTFDELQVDSLDLINLSFEVEELFNIEIPDAALTSLRTVGDVINGVERLRAQKATSH